MRWVHTGLLAASVAFSAAGAQGTPAERYIGSWAGRLEAGQTFRVVLHVAAANGGIATTMDSPDQGVSAMRTESIVRNDSLIVSVRGAFTFETRLHSADTLDAVFVQGGTRIPLRLTRQAPPRPPSYIEEEIAIANGEVRISGAVTRPKNGARFPAILLIAGAGPLGRDGVVAGHAHMLAMAEYLTSRGYAVLRYDKRGVGKSTGDYSQATSTDLTDDAIAALRALARRPYVDSARVAVIGHSEGGIIASRVAAVERLAAVVVLAAPSIPGERLMLDRSEMIARAKGVADSTLAKERDLRRTMLADIVASRDTVDARSRLTSTVARGLPRFSGFEKRALGFVDGDWLGFVEILVAQRTWFREWLPADPASGYARMKAPALIVFGGSDQQVPVSLNLARMKEAAGSSAVTIEVLADHNHLLQRSADGSPLLYGRLSEAISPVALELVGQWLSRIL